MYIISIALLCGAVRGWDKQGHRLAGRVASKLLTGRAKSFLYDHIVEGDVSSVAAAVSAVSSWADEEGRELYPQSRQRHFSFTDEKQCSPFELDRDCGVNGSK